MLIIATILYILSSAITTRRDQTIFYNRFILIILINSILIAYQSMLNLKTIGLYNNFFIVGSINTTFNIFVFILTFIILTLSSFFPRKILGGNIKFYELLINKSAEQYKILEYPLIILFIIMGAIFLMNSNDIVSLFLSLELQSYGVYILCTLYRNSELSTSSGLTYFLLGSLSSCFVLLGTGLVYLSLGITNIDNYYLINNINDFKHSIQYMLMYNNTTNYFLLIISVGLLFKISAAPFHFWSPDVYDGIPTITTTFVAIVTKISILMLMFELVNYTNNNLFDISWTIGILFSSFLSLIIGTILGLNQSRIKRLLAYSTISHLGFILLSLTINSIESIQAFVFYIIQYSLSNLNSFIILITIGYTLYYYTKEDNTEKKLLDKNNSPVQLINQLKGLFALNPLLSISFTLTIYSLIGVPPLIGFFGKQIVLSSSLDQGYVFISLIAILTSVISAVYYLNIIKNMFFETNEYKINLGVNINIKISNTLKYIYKNMFLSGNLTVCVSILTLIITTFILNPEELLNLANLLSTTIFT